MQQFSPPLSRSFCPRSPRTATPSTCKRPATRTSPVAATWLTIPPNTFDLSDLPSYKPEQQVSGIIRMTGSNYIADSHVGENWLAAFKKFQPGITFEFNLKTPSAAVYALFLNAGDVDPSRKMTFRRPARLRANHECRSCGDWEYATGSYDVPGWSPAFGIFVNKANPITKLSIAQLEAIFGAERTGAWEGTSWHPERARSTAENIRTWGQLGLTGQWADKPIHVYGVNLRYHQAIRFEDQVMHGSAKWNPTLLEYANYGKLRRNACHRCQHDGRRPRKRSIRDLLLRRKL